MKALGSSGLIWSFALFLGLASGCRKEIPQAADAVTAKTPIAATPTEIAASPVKPTLYEPFSVKIGGEPQLPAQFVTAYEESAVVLKTFTGAPPYERIAILKSALPSIQLLASLKRNLSKSESDVASGMLKIDPRFAGIIKIKEINSLFFGFPRKAENENSNNNYVKDTEKVTERGAPRDPGSPTVTVSRNGPDAFINGAGQLGKKMKQLAVEKHLEGNLEQVVQKLFAQIVAQGTNWEQVVAIQKADTVEQKAAKIGLKKAYGEFLNLIVAYQGSSFFCARTRDGDTELCEFKQPITLEPSQILADEITKLNTGVELTVQIDLSVSSDDGYLRKYENGMWGSWKQAPTLASVQIVKAGGFKTQWTPESTWTSFTRPTSKQIDLALGASDSTRRVSKAESAAANSAGPGTTAEENITLLQYAVTRKAHDEALEFSRVLLEDESLSPDTAKKIASSLLDLLQTSNPGLVDAYYGGRLFDYYASYQKSSELGEMSPKPYPKRNTTKHPYGVVDEELIKRLIFAYQSISKAEPNNTDAEFDIAFFETILGNADQVDAASWTLLKAFGDAQKKRPVSGRDFKSIISRTPTFVAMDHEGTGTATENIYSILSKCGVKEPQFHFSNNFLKEMQLYSAGY